MPAILSADQIGWLRRIDNLSRRPDNDWSEMNGKGTGQEDFGAYRFQLAYMGLAAALAHVHRLPAAPGLFRPMLQRLLHKLLLRDVWDYWQRTSRGGAAWNRHIEYPEELDPCRRDNIMYSAYVALLAQLHDYLFGADTYARPGAIAFTWASQYQSPRRDRDVIEFRYDRGSLAERIHDQFVGSGYVGVCCEPNASFVICNQVTLMVERLHDWLTGQDRTTEILPAYRAAWDKLGGWTDESGHYRLAVTADTHDQLLSPRAWADGWCMTVLHTFYPDYVACHYEDPITSWLVTAPDGTLAVRSTPDGSEQGREPSDRCDFGWIAAAMAELGDTDRLARMRGYADRYPGRAWDRHGGLYHPRNDTPSPEGLVFAPMDSVALDCMAGLNVPGGLHRFFAAPADPVRFDQPAITEVDPDVDISQAEVDGGVLRTHLRRTTTPMAPGTGTVAVSRLIGCGDWTVDVDGRPAARIHGATVTPEPGAADGRVRAADGRILVATDPTPHTVTFTPAPHHS